MAIHNLSGNFQPPPANSGRNLPQSGSREPSVSAGVKGNSLQVVAKDVPSINKPIELVATITENEITQARKDKSQIEEIQQFNQSIDRSLKFEVDKELGVTIVRVVDRETDELIRQFPPEELINLSRRLKELNDENTGNSGILLREKV